MGSGGSKQEITHKVLNETVSAAIIENRQKCLSGLQNTNVAALDLTCSGNLVINGIHQTNTMQIDATSCRQASSVIDAVASNFKTQLATSLDAKLDGGAGVFPWSKGVDQSVNTLVENITKNTTAITNVMDCIANNINTNELNILGNAKNCAVSDIRQSNLMAISTTCVADQSSLQDTIAKGVTEIQAKVKAESTSPLAFLGDTFQKAFTGLFGAWTNTVQYAIIAAVVVAVITLVVKLFMHSSSSKESRSRRGGPRFTEDEYAEMEDAVSRRMTPRRRVASPTGQAATTTATTQAATVTS